MLTEWTMEYELTKGELQKQDTGVAEESKEIIATEEMKAEKEWRSRW